MLAPAVLETAPWLQDMKVCSQANLQAGVFAGRRLCRWDVFAGRRFQSSVASTHVVHDPTPRPLLAILLRRAQLKIATVFGAFLDPVADKIM